MVISPLHVLSHGFPRAAEALVVQPPANPVLPSSPFAFVFSLTLLADIPGVPTEFLHATE